MGPAGFFAVHSTFSGHGYLAFEVFVYFSFMVGNQESRKEDSSDESFDF